MRIAAIVARYLLGVIFLVFGLNGFLHFLPTPPMAAGPAVDFMVVMTSTHYMTVVFAVQLIAAILFLANRYVPLALTLIAPVIVNILIFHSLMQPAGLPPGVLVTILWIILAMSVRSAFAGILQPKTTT
jgi:putative oxidoreductase